VSDTVELDAAALEHIGDPLRRGPAEQGLHARNEFGNREGLHHIVVGAGLQPADAVTFLAARRQHDDGKALGILPGADLTANFNAGKPRQHPIQYDEIGLFLVEHQHGVATRGDVNDGVAFRLQIIGEQGDD